MDNKQLWPGWKTVRVIGSGGFGKVYEIRKSDDTGDYPSALKVITIPQSPDEYSAYVDDGYDEKSITAIFKSQIDDIVTEFQLMAQFKGTSNIVSYEEHMIVPHEDGHGWDILIRMELLTSLPDYYNQHGMSEADTIKLGMDICRALELCAQKNIIHRDIKPQNIFVNAFGDFKLGDFGIAKTMDHTTKATKIGTYNYMAPEVYQGRPYNATADIYSLGLVLYWLLNERRLPFQPLPPAVPTAAQNSEAQSRRLSGEAFDHPKNGGGGLGRVVLKACAANATNRYRTASEMRSALASIQSGHEPAVEPEPEEPTLEDRQLRCKYCGAVITEKTAICPNCKEPTEITISQFDTVCKKCGCITPADLDRCTLCGATLIEESPEPESPTNHGGGATQKRFCATCGRPIPDGIKKCPYCDIGMGDPGPENDLTCPWCRGSGREKLVRYKGNPRKNHYWASDEACNICHGSGQLYEKDAPLLLKQFDVLKETEAYKGANHNCSCCGGIGYVHFEGVDDRARPCPQCAGHNVAIYSQQQIEDNFNKKLRRKIRLWSFNLFFWLTGGAGFVTDVTKSGTSDLSVPIAVAIFLAAAVLPLLLVLRKAWSNPITDRKTALRTTAISVIVALVFVAFLAFSNYRSTMG